MSQWTVTEPGVVDGMPDEVYQRDPVPGGSLSASGAKTLLRAPALFAYQREHGRPNRREYDIGHAAHHRLLGVGPDLVVIEADNYLTKAAKQAKADAYAAGRVPVLPKELVAVDAMVAALKAHPFAALLFDPARGGKPEQSFFWGGDYVWLRARLDWLPDPDAPGRLIIPDFKTAECAAPAAVRRMAGNYSWHIQDAFYRAAVDNVLGIQPEFVFVVQEKTPPYLVTVAELDDDALAAGHAAMRRAIDTYRSCRDTDNWPGYADDVVEISLPPWQLRTEEDW